MESTSSPLTIGDLAARTGVPIATIRSWESRYGFPSPSRAPGGHRRYVEGDVAAVAEVLAHRRAGLSLEAAVRRTTTTPVRPRSVYAEVRRHSSSINLSTVYRTLELLDDLGLIRHAHLTDRAPTYHSARGHEHAHLVCRSCRTVISIGRDDIEKALGPLAAEHGFQPDYGHLTVFGTCASCAGEG